MVMNTGNINNILHEGKASSHDVTSSKEVVEVKDQNGEKIESLQFADQAPVVMSVDQDAAIVPTNPYGAPTIADYLSRVYPIFTFAWSASSAQGDQLAQISLPGALLQQRALAEKMSRFAYLKCKFHISIRVNGTAFHYGKLLVAYNLSPPDANSYDYIGRDNIFSVSAFPHVIVSPGQNEVQEFDIPFIYPLDYYPLESTTINYGAIRDMASIFVYVLNPLQAGSTVPDVSVTVYANMFDVQFAGYSNGLVTYVDQTITDFTERNLKWNMLMKRRTTTMQGKIPKIKFEAQVGLDKVELALPDFNRSVRDAIFLGTDDMYQHPGSTNMDSDASLQDFHNIISREALLTSFVMTSGDNVGDELASFDVNPTVVASVSASNGTIFYRTPLSTIAAAFEQWRGTMRYKLQIIASQFHSGRIQVLYYPANITYDATEPYELLSRIVDIQRDTEFKFSIPYTDVIPYRSAGNPIGRIVIKVVNNLTFKETPVPDISMNIWVSGASDMQFSLPDASYTVYNTAEPVFFDAQVATGSKEPREEYCELAPFGSNIINNLKIPATTYRTMISKANTIAQFAKPPDDSYRLVDTSPNGSIQVVDTLTVPSMYGTPFYTPLFFLSRFRRGGVIYIINQRSTGTNLDNVENGYMCVNLQPDVTLNCEPINVSSSIVVSDQFINPVLSVRSSNLAQQPLTIRVPYYGTINYQENIIASEGTGNSRQSYRSQRPTVDLISSAAFEYSIAGDDDLDFYFQIGPPYLFIDT